MQVQMRFFLRLERQGQLRLGLRLERQGQLRLGLWPVSLGRARAYEFMSRASAPGYMDS
mgnify:FL=1